MFSFKSIVLIAAAFAINVECSGLAVPAVAAPLVAPAHVGYTHAVPQNIPPYAAQISVVNRAFSPLVAAPYAGVAAPFAAPVAPYAAPLPAPVGFAARFAAAPFPAASFAAAPYAAAPLAAAPYYAGAAPYALPGPGFPAAYAAPYPYAAPAPLLRAPFTAPAFVR